MAGLVPAVA